MTQRLNVRAVFVRETSRLNMKLKKQLQPQQQNNLQSHILFSYFHSFNLKGLIFVGFDECEDKPSEPSL